MKGWHFILRSLRFYWRTNLCIVFGLALATAVITGSLLVGDSMRESLQHNALRRLGNIDQALVAPHFFRAALATELNADPAPHRRAQALPVLLIRGSAQHGQENWRIPNVSVCGVTADFWTLFPSATAAPALGGKTVALNQALADDLHLQPGDDIIVSVDRMGAVADEVLFAQRRREETLHVLRLHIAGIVPDSAGGAFAMGAQTSAPRSVFMDREFLATALERPGAANAILVPQSPTAAEPPDLQSALARHAALADYGLKLVLSTAGQYVALESSTLLLTAEHLAAAQTAAAETQGTAEPTSVYLATHIDKVSGTQHSLGYAIVAAIGATPSWPWAPGRDPENDSHAMGLNRWAADDLDAHLGDDLEMTYLIPATDGTYRTATTRLKVSGIVPLSGPAADRHLTPDLNGMTDAKRIGQWKTPFPIEHERLTPRDEEYWDQFGPTPKAFVSRATMQDIWTHANGSAERPWITAIRLVPPARADLAAFAQQIAQGLLRHLTPAQNQMVFRPLRQQLLASATGSNDFGQLFLAMSFFLVLAAAALAGMFMRLLTQQRAAETGIMLACGWRGRQVMHVAIAQGLALLTLATLTGLPAGVLYNQLILHAMGRWWLRPWDHPPLLAHVTFATLAWGGIGGAVVGVGCILWATRALRRLPVLQLLSGRQVVAMLAPPLRARWRRWLPTLLGLGGLALLAAAATKAVTPELTFFGGGTSLLAAALAQLWVTLGRRLERPGTVVSLWGLAIRNAAANRSRSILTIGLLACASFILVAVAANRRDFSHLDVRDKTSGAGGFALRATTAVPLHYDLASAVGRAHLGFSPQQEAAFTHVAIIPLQQSPGDDISCLNLARPMQPRLLGVPPALQECNAFSVQLARAAPGANPWQALDGGPDGDGAIPAFADADSIEWTLHSGLGEIYSFTGPDGKPVKLRIAGVLPGSIFAGEMLISQANWQRLYPTIHGANSFLLAAEPQQQAALVDALRSSLADFGLEVHTTREILNSFIGVQNIYLAIFMTLGGLGLLLGTAGMVAVIARNALERRGELALLTAVGFTRDRLVRLVVLENAALLLTGLGCGTLAALLAVAPVVGSGQARVPWSALAALLVAVTGFGLAWAIMAARLSIGTTPIQALREE